MASDVAITAGARVYPRKPPSTHASLLDAFVNPEPWVQDALCAQTDPEAFFPEKGGSTRDAKAICNGRRGEVGCEVREQCLAYALDRDERFGIWGGLSERQRRRLRKEREAS
jgi:WhiB family redox-sensing transcriptional regulator